MIVREVAKPNPGSAEARAAGCKCDPRLNYHGSGIAHPRGRFFYTANACPLHAPPVEVTEEPTNAGR